MALSRIDGVDSDGIGVQGLQKRNVPLAPSGVDQGVLEVCVCCGCSITAKILLVRHAFDEELGPIGLVEELGSLDDDGVNVRGDR